MQCTFDEESDRERLKDDLGQARAVSAKFGATGAPCGNADGSVSWRFARHRFNLQLFPKSTFLRPKFTNDELFSEQHAGFPKTTGSNFANHVLAHPLMAPTFASVALATACAEISCASLFRAAASTAAAS